MTGLCLLKGTLWAKPQCGTRALQHQLEVFNQFQKYLPLLCGTIFLSSTPSFDLLDAPILGQPLKVFLGLVIYLVGNLVPIGTSVLSMSGHLTIAFLVFPLSLLAIGFLEQRERDAIQALLRQGASYIGRWRGR